MVTRSVVDTIMSIPHPPLEPSGGGGHGDNDLHDQVMHLLEQSGEAAVLLFASAPEAFPQLLKQLQDVFMLMAPKTQRTMLKKKTKT